MSKPVVISGEASETDSEDEVVIPVATLGVKGEVVTGEDSESEDENGGSVCSAESAMHQSHTTDNVKNIQYDSLLHQKLRECNIKLHNDIETHCDNCIEEASKTLNVIDQQLLKSQVTLQNAATSLKTLSATSVTLKNKLQSLLSAKFLPNVKVHD